MAHSPLWHTLKGRHTKERSKYAVHLKPGRAAHHDSTMDVIVRAPRCFICLIVLCSQLGAAEYLEGDFS